MTEITNFQGRVTSQAPEDQINAEVAALIARVGDRVRKARELKGISRRVLSEKSGVSPRYLAQLEAGEGNISIGLLQRIAIALDHRIEWLTGSEDPWNSDALKVADLFRRADGDTQKAVLRFLDSEPAEHLKAQRMCLVGLRGAGKSTLGAMASKTLGLPFVELNAQIEEQSGMPVPEVMALYGQEGYRKLEAQAVSRIIATHEAMVLAVAGGIVGEPETYATLLKHFHTVWIKATPDEHMARVRAQGDERPMVGNPEAMDQLRSILTSREALYNKAQVQIDTSGRSIDESLQDLLKTVEENGFLA
jgi:XRE family transcriptional regulator, aerobic/anaerobic benzoate catabolism transcriptional regulator